MTDQEIWDRFINLATYIAKSYDYGGYNWPTEGEMVSVSMEKLIATYREFKKKESFKFYASKIIRFAIIDFIRQSTGKSSNLNKTTKKEKFIKSLVPICNSNGPRLIDFSVDNNEQNLDFRSDEIKQWIYSVTDVPIDWCDNFVDYYIHGLTLDDISKKTNVGKTGIHRRIFQVVDNIKKSIAENPKILLDIL